MHKITLAAFATVAATLASAPAFAMNHGNSYGHGHSSHGHASHAHRHVSTHGHNTYKPSYHAPVYHAPKYVAPAYVAPTYYAPKYEAPKVTTSYETRPAYVYQKVAGTCTDVVKSNGYNSVRKTVDCKAGDVPKAEHAPKVEVPAEPPK